MQLSIQSVRNNSAASDIPDPLINSAEQRRLAGGVSLMTIYRWTQAGILPPPLKIRGRNYRYRSEFMAALEAAGQGRAA